MPTAGRVSRPDGVVVGEDECALVVSGTAVRVVGDHVGVGVALAVCDAVTVVVVVLLGAGALTIGGGGMAAAGSGRTGTVVVTGAKVSTVVGVSSG
jgi:hypothetical protein